MANEHGVTLPVLKSGTGFLHEVKGLFHGKREEYDKFVKDIDDFKRCMNDHHRVRLPVQEFKQRVNEVLKGHMYLILGFNDYMRHYRIRLPIPIHHDQQLGHKTGKKMKAAENCELPWDLLDIISRMIDFDDLFQFGSVCKNWRAFHKIYWRNFMAFQEPLLVQRSRVKNGFSFISLSHQKVYHSKMANNFVIFAYHGSSSGYLIMTGKNNSFILINLFTRRKMVINNSVFKVDYSCGSCHVLLAFYRGSEEFVLVVLCRGSNNLHVYQSRNLGWVTYSTPHRVVDFVVLHNTIYVITDKANIGILSLNSANINFLDLKSTPSVTYADYAYVRLVSCDEHLLVLNFTSNIMFNLYKIDFSTMNYVKLESLGDIALFHASKKKYYALNNPSMWGYENNSVYVTNNVIHKIRVYKGDDNKMPELIPPSVLIEPTSDSEQPYLYLDWCFRHLNYVDYCLVE